MKYSDICGATSREPAALARGGRRAQAGHGHRAGHPAPTATRDSRDRENIFTPQKIQKREVPVLNHRVLVTDPETIVVCIYL